MIFRKAKLGTLAGLLIGALIVSLEIAGIQTLYKAKEPQAVTQSVSSIRTLEDMLQKAQKANLTEMPVETQLPATEVEAKKELADLPKTIAVPKPEISRGEGYTKVLTGFEITFYNNDGISYTTASGTRTVDGITVGADPKIIPFGTWVELILPDGRVLKRRIEDTGGGVKGRKVIDVYANQPRNVLLQRGRIRNVTVKVLGKG